MLGWARLTDGLSLFGRVSIYYRAYDHSPHTPHSHRQTVFPQPADLSTN